MGTMEAIEPEPAAEFPLAAIAPADRLSALYELHAPAALGFAFLICGNRELADDAVQEAFERLMTRFGGLRRPDAFSAYLQRTVLNVLRARARSEQRSREREKAHVSSLSGSIEAVDVDADGRLWAALQALPERQRAAVVCRFWMDLSERDTARVLGCRRGTAKSLLSRALASMREMIADG